MNRNPAPWLRYLVFCAIILVLAATALMAGRSRMKDAPAPPPPSTTIATPSLPDTPPSTPASAASESTSSNRPKPSSRAITGTVRSAKDGKPLAGARVAVETSPLTLGPAVRPSLSEAVTGAQGTYSIPIEKAWAPRSGNTLHLHAEAEGYAGSAIPLPSSSASLEHDFLLSEGATISGRVIDQKDIPVAKASLFAIVADEDRDDAYYFSSTTSADDGTFLIPGVPVGYKITVSASADEYTTTIQPSLSPGAKDVTIVLTKSSGRVTGIVTDSRKPSAGVLVSAYRQHKPPRKFAASSWETMSRTRATTTAKDGSYVLTGLADGTWELTAENENGQASAEFTIVMGDSAERNLELPDATYVRGRFTGGEDMSGIVLHPNGPGDPRTIQTSRDGRFRVKAKVLSSVKGIGTITFPFQLPLPWTGGEAIPSRGKALAEEIEGALIGQENEHEVHLKKGYVAKGRVLQQDGVTPAAGSNIALFDVAEALIQPVMGSTDASGNFELTFWRPAATIIAKGKHGFGEVRVIGEDEFAKPIIIILQPNGAVSGRITDDTGKPVVRMAVSDEPFDEMPTYSDEDGKYFIDDVTPGERHIQIAGDSIYLDVPPKTVTVESGKILTDVNFVLSLANAIVGQTIDAETGEPIAEATVRASSPYAFRDDQPKPVLTGADGRFTIIGPSDGSSMEITFSHPDYVTTTLLDVPTGADEVVVPMQSASGLTLKFLIKETETPAQHINISATSAMNGIRSLWPIIKEKNVDLKNGEFPLKLTDPNPVWVTALELDAEGKLTGRQGSALLDPKLRDKTRHIIYLTSRAKITGSLTDEAGKPVPDVELSLREYLGGGIADVPQRTTTDLQGMFTYRDIADGTYDISADVPQGGGILAGDTKVEVKEGNAPPVRLKLIDGIQVCGTLIGPDGKPVGEGGYVTIDPGTGRPAWPRADTDANGAFCFNSLNPGTYEAYVMLPGTSSFIQVEALSVSDEGGRWDIDLSRRIALSGSLILNGKPALALSSVTLEGPEIIKLLYAQSTSYEARILPGDYHLVAIMEGRRLQWGPFRFEGSGEQKFDFHLELVSATVRIDGGGNDPLPRSEIRFTRLDQPKPTSFTLPIASHSLTIPTMVPGTYVAELLFEGAVVTESDRIQIYHGYPNTFALTTERPSVEPPQP